VLLMVSGCSGIEGMGKGASDGERVERYGGRWGSVCDDGERVQPDGHCLG